MSALIFSPVKGGYSSSPSYCICLLGGPKGTLGALRTNGVPPRDLRSSSTCLLPVCFFLGMMCVYRKCLQCSGDISTEVPWRGSTCSKEYTPDCGFISASGGKYLVARMASSTPHVTLPSHSSVLLQKAAQCGEKRRGFGVRESGYVCRLVCFQRYDLGLVT